MKVAECDVGARGRTMLLAYHLMHLRALDRASTSLLQVFILYLWAFAVDGSYTDLIAHMFSTLYSSGICLLSTSHAFAVYHFRRNVLIRCYDSAIGPLQSFTSSQLNR